MKGQKLRPRRYCSYPLGAPVTCQSGSGGPFYLSEYKEKIRAEIIRQCALFEKKVDFTGK